jgi:signal transduction histidine kinase
VLAAVLCALALGATGWLALRQPWLGAHFALSPEGDAIVLADALPDSGAPAGSRVHALGAVPLEPTDLAEDADQFDDATAVRFLARQDRLAAEMSNAPLRLSLADGTIVDLPPAQSRPWSTLPATFWLQLASGAGGFMIGAWVWCFKPREPAARLFVLSGLGLMISAHAAAVYSSRELALPAAEFFLLDRVNFAGAALFGGAMVGLFLAYPRRIGPRWLAPAMLALLLLLSLLILSGLAPDYSTGVYTLFLLDMTLILVLIGVQAWSNRRDPAGRAALFWLGLSVVAGAGGFTLVVTAPILLGGAPVVSQGYAFGLFAVIYLGIAVGLGRFHLFDLGEWAFRLLFFFGAAAAILLIDLALVTWLELGPPSAFGIGLVVVAVLYLPVRERLWRLTLGRRGVGQAELVERLTGIAFEPEAPARAEKLGTLLSRMFAPLEIEPAEFAGEAPEVADSGLALLWPATRDTGALRLRYPAAGRGLFSRAAVAQAEGALTVLRRFQEGRDAYAEGALAERQRIARDLHDDVGARLLTGIHEAPPQVRPLLREALADIRTIVGGLAGERRTIERVLADLRHETLRRLEAAGIALDWPVGEERRDTLIDYDLYKNLGSAFRELVSNVIRHSGAKALAVRVEATPEALVLTLADDGRGLAQPDGGEGGHGLGNAAARLAALGGSVEFPAVPNGTTVVLRLPIRAAAPRERGLQSRPDRA